MKQKKALLIGIVFFLFLAGAQYCLKVQEKIQLEQKEYQSRLEEGKMIAEESRQEYESRFLALLEQRQEPSFRYEAAGIDTLPVFCIGDSVMLGAEANLQSVFPAGMVDAKENRSFYPVYVLIQEKLEEGKEFGPVVIGIGTNGPLDYEYCTGILKLCGERDVFWLTTTNNWQFDNTDTIMALGQTSDHVTIIDWDSFSEGHEEYFYSDEIHLTPEGRKAYADLVLWSVEEKILSRMKQEPSLLLIGDDSLLACLSGLEDLSDTFVIAQEELDPDSISTALAQLREKGILPDQAVLVCHGENQETLGQLLPLLSELKVRILLLEPGDKIEEKIREKTGEKTNETGSPETVIYSAQKEELTHDLHLNENGRRNFAAWLEETIAFPREEKQSIPEQ